MTWLMLIILTVTTFRCATPVKLESGVSSSMLATAATVRSCLIYSYYPIRIPESRRPAVAELLSRINIAIWLGCFAMDWRDGEVSIRTSMPVADGEFTDQQLERLFYANLGLADRHLSGVCAVAFGNVPPALAIELAEVPPKEGLQ